MVAHSHDTHRGGSTQSRPLATVPRRRRASSRAAMLWYVPLIGLVIVFLFPTVFMVASSFKPSDLVQADIGSWRAFWPTPFRPENYREVFRQAAIGRFLVNSFVTTLITLVCGVFVNSMAAYAFAILRFRGRDVLFALVVSLLIVPFEAILLPLFLTVNAFGWLNSYQVLVVPFIANALFVFLFRQFFLGIPRDLIEAARLDGASYFTIYRAIVMPLSLPVVATVAILVFLERWNDFLWPLITLTDDRKYTAMIGLQYFFTGEKTEWGLVMAATFVITLPLLIVFFIFQKFFVQSVATVGLKD